MNKTDNLYFFQGQQSYFDESTSEGSIDSSKRLDALKAKIRELLNLKNVNFLFGSGTSNGAIPTMTELFSSLAFNESERCLEQEFKKITAKVGKDLESCLGVMYSARVYYNGLEASDDTERQEISSKSQLYESLIKKIEKHIFDSINIDFKSDDQRKVLGYYKTFYQKLALRTKDNSRIRIFTTNNDLFNEEALDSLNIHYINGFSGGLHRFFNPAIFNYTFSKRMDTSIDKYEPVENMVYLYKIHGSVNWRESENGTNNYFEIEEVAQSDSLHNGAVLIYPTPTKYEKSLSNLYVDLFREFQNKLLEPHSVLFVIGYSFSDKHVNDVIYRALATNSSLNVVIFGSKPKDKPENRRSKPIFFSEDNRIFTVYGKAEAGEGAETSTPATIHHFDYIVSNLLPNMDSSRSDDDILEKFLSTLRSKSKNENR